MGDGSGRPITVPATAETGQTVQRIAADTNRDFWMGPEEARKYGLISHIIHSSDEV